MYTKKSIQNEISQLDILKVISRAYAQIASMKIKKMKDNVLQSREYLDSINDVFQEVLATYLEEVEKSSKGGKGQGITFLSHNGRSVAVLVSANSRMYGDLIQRTFALFLEGIKNKDIEATIVGKYGLSLFEEALPNKPFTYFDYPDASLDPKALATLIAHLVQYEEIYFYYPEFQNAVIQKPKVFKISSGVAFSQEKEGPKKREQYLFEPSLEAVLTFFESQIFTSMMEQTLEESQLAKLASRVMSMDRAEVKVKEELKKLRIQKLKINHQIINKKQMHVLTGISLWR